MSDKGVDQAVEKILADPAFARQVLDTPEWALTSNFPLLVGEWRSISWALLQDVLDSTDFKQIKYNLLAQLPKLKGNIDRADEDPTVHARLMR